MPQSSKALVDTPVTLLQSSLSVSYSFRRVTASRHCHCLAFSSILTCHLFSIERLSGTYNYRCGSILAELLT